MTSRYSFDALSVKIIIIVELRHGSLSCLKIFSLDKVCFVGDEAEIKTVKKNYDRRYCTGPLC